MENYCVKTALDILYLGPDGDLAGRIFDRHVKAGGAVFMYLDKRKPDIEVTKKSRALSD